MTPSTITIKQRPNWLTIIGWVVAAILLFLLWRSCKNNPAPVGKDYKPELDSVQIVKSKDSARNQYIIDSIKGVANKQFDKVDSLSDLLGKKGKDINYLSSLIRSGRRDTIRTVEQQLCDSLAIIAPVYVAMTDSLIRVTYGLVQSFQSERQAYDERDSLTNIAYLSAVDIAVRANETIRDMRPKASMWVGVSGSGNLDRVTAGPSLMFVPRNGRWMMGGSYQVGNSKPVYGLGYHRKISLR